MSTPNNPQQWYGQQPAPARTNSNAILGFVLSLAGLVLGLGFILGIPGLIISRKAEGELGATGEGGAGLAKAGVIIGWIDIALSIVGILLFVLLLVLGVSLGAAGGSTADCIANSTAAGCSSY